MDDPRRLEAAGDETDANQPQLHPEVEAFARWFADWWLRRGCQLVAERKQREREEERRAA